MSVKFVLGRAGTGKTHYFTQLIKEKLRKEPRGNPLVLLVPEQATFQMEQAFLQEGIEGFTRLHILSFKRLSKRILEITGGDNKVYLTDTGKEMILKNIIRERINEGRINFLQRAAIQKGFSSKLANFIREAKMYRIRPEDIMPVKLSRESTNNKEGKNYFHNKLEEISLLYSDYESFIEDDYQHKEDYYIKAFEKMDDFDMLKSSEVYIDGFFGFTPRELNMLEKIFTNAVKAEISLTLDPHLLERNCRETELFYPVIETYNKIYELATKNKLPIEEPLVFSLDENKRGGRFENSNELYLLEKNYEKISPGEIYSGPTENIQMIQASNRRAEIEKIARLILSDVREGDKRFKDISLIVKNFEDYEPLIKSIFSKYEIPYFIDRKELIHHHPLVEFIRSALEIFINDWPYESVFRCLKTDLLEIDRDNVDRLENYVLAHGITGKKWIDDKPWDYLKESELENIKRGFSNKQKRYLEEINQIRDSATRALKLTYKKLHSGQDSQTLTVKEITLEMWDLFKRLDVQGKVESWIENCETSREHQDVQLHTRVWEELVALFEQLVDYMGEKKLRLNEYLEVLEAGLENISLGVIPPSLDQVIVGSVERSRQHNIKSIFIPGMCEGAFPAVYLESGIFNDNERKIMRDMGIELAPTTERRLYDEQFWSYIALTRAKEKLVISYPLSGQDESVLQPSPIIERIKRIFPGLEEEYFHEDLIEEDYSWIVSPEIVIPIMVQYLKEQKIFKESDMQELSSFWKQLYSLIKNEYEDELAKNPAVSGLYYKNEVDRLERDFVKTHYSGVLKSSVSGLESFATCKFKFFADKMLNLKEREYYRLDPLGFGLLYHAVLKLFFERLKEENIAWKDIHEDRIDVYIEDIMNRLSESMKSKILESSARNRYITEKIKEHLNNAVSILREHEIEGGFSPAYAELDFGEKGEISPLEIEIDETTKLSLEGKIDRVDEGDVGDKKYIRIIDYKSSSRPLNLKELYYGINLQLPVYLLVVLKQWESLFRKATKEHGVEILPAGMLYFGVKNPLISADSPLDDNEAVRRFKNEMKMDGYILNNREVYLAMTGGNEELLKQKYSDNQGRFTSYSRVLGEEEFEKLLTFVENNLVRLGREINRGEFSPDPYRDKRRTPCGICPYHAVCQFDPRFGSNNYRRLEKGSGKDYLEKIVVEGMKEDG